MINTINNAIKAVTETVKGTVDGFMVQFSGNNRNANRNMNVQRDRYVPPPQPTGIKFSDMGSRNTRLSPVVQDSNPVVNGIKFSSD